MNQDTNRFVLGVLGIVGFFALCLFGNYYTYGSFVKPPPKPVVDSIIDNREIVSMGRETEVSGGFILGIGTIDSVIYYIAYEKKGENTFSLLKVRAEGVDIVETDSEKPSYQVYGHDGLEKKRTITVPKGTIRKEFKL